MDIIHPGKCIAPRKYPQLFFVMGLRHTHEFCGKTSYLLDLYWYGTDPFRDMVQIYSSVHVGLPVTVDMVNAHQQVLNMILGSRGCPRYLVVTETCLRLVWAIG